MNKKFNLFVLMFLFASMGYTQTIMHIHKQDGTVLDIPLNALDSIKYSISNPGNLADVITKPVEILTMTSVKYAGQVTYDGGTLVSHRGFVWDTLPNPSLINNSIFLGSGIGDFNAMMSGLKNNTTYFVRAFAINSAGIQYGIQMSFTTPVLIPWLNTNVSYGSVQDYEGNEYKTVKIGNKEWMAENLRSTKYATGDSMTKIISDWYITLYSGYKAYTLPVGNLYNGYIVNDSRNVCPTNWHVSNWSDWSDLIYMVDSSAIGSGPSYVGIGKPLKSIGDQFWESGGSPGTNTTGFSAVGTNPGNYETNIWISDFLSSQSKYTASMSYGHDNLTIAGNALTFGGTIRCVKDGKLILKTKPITNISKFGANSGGEITYDGLTPIIQRGLVYSLSPNPTLLDNSVNSPNTQNDFGCFISFSGLLENTTYYVRAFVRQANDTIYGDELTFTTLPPLTVNQGNGVFYQGKQYASVLYGNGQEWFAENLNVSCYSNGDSIVHVKGQSDWISHPATGAWCFYNNDSILGQTYGKLYNWYVVNDSRNVCPSGWRVPSNTDWDMLIDYVGFSGKLKSTGLQFWQSPNADATNESLFSGLPGGIRNESGEFDLIGLNAYWWQKTNDQKIFNLSNNVGYGSYTLNSKQFGLSLRCIKN